MMAMTTRSSINVNAARRQDSLGMDDHSGFESLLASICHAK